MSVMASSSCMTQTPTRAQTRVGKMEIPRVTMYVRNSVNYLISLCSGGCCGYCWAPSCTDERDGVIVVHDPNAHSSSDASWENGNSTRHDVRSEFRELFNF